MRMRPVETAASRERRNLVGMLRAAHRCSDLRSSRGAETSDASEAFAKSIPDARFELIDAVHMMPAQASGALLALLKDFLGKHAS